MLIQRTEVKEGEIATFRLVSGEEIVGKFLSLNQDGDVKINKPVILGVQMVGPQQASFAFSTFLRSEYLCLSFETVLLKIFVFETKWKKCFSPLAATTR